MASNRLDLFPPTALERTAIRLVRERREITDPAPISHRSIDVIRINNKKTAEEPAAAIRATIDENMGMFARS